MSRHTLAISGDRVWKYLKLGVDAIAIPVSKTLGPEAVGFQVEKEKE